MGQHKNESYISKFHLTIAKKWAYTLLYGEEGIQLVQPWKFFSVGVLVCMRANWDYMLLLVTLKNFDVCTVTMSVRLQWIELIGFNIDCIDYVLNRDWKHNTNSRIALLFQRAAAMQVAIRNSSVNSGRWTVLSLCVSKGIVKALHLFRASYKSLVHLEYHGRYTKFTRDKFLKMAYF